MRSEIKFGTDGWRDIIADNFTYRNISIVVSAICNYLRSAGKGKKGIYIGYDSRFMSERFSLYIAAILVSKGINAFLSRSTSPTPTTAFMVKNLDLDGSFMITASHNPPIYNGIKFIPEYAGPADKTITDAIEIELAKIRDEDISGMDSKVFLKEKDLTDKITWIEDLEDYKDFVMQSLDTGLIEDTDISIAVNTMYGAANRILPEIIERKLKKKEIRKINDSNDPLFGGMLPDPSEKNLDTFKNLVISEGFDIGIAVDGDADRFGVIDGKGKYISPNNGICIILDYLISKGTESDDIAVRSIATTHLIDEICKKHGIKVIETPVGFKHIGKLMLKGNVLIGGEESGGISIKGHIPEKDGILATLLLIEIQCFLTKNNRGYLSDYLEDLYKEYGYFLNTRLDKEIPMDMKAKVITYFREKNDELFGLKIAKKIDIDGIKIIFDEGSWLLVRASGTEPLIRCYLESTKPSTFDMIKQSLNDLIESETSS